MLPISLADREALLQDPTAFLLQWLSIWRHIMKAAAHLNPRPIKSEALTGDLDIRAF